MSTFYDEIGGEETITRIVARFYAGVATDEVLRPMYPEADLPILQISLPSLSPGELIEMGRMLAPLW